MKKTIISIIAIIGKNRELGKDGKLLWNIPEDMKRFKKLTTGHVVIMGRKTFESIGKPLPNRINIVITKNVKNLVDSVPLTSLKDKHSSIFPKAWVLIRSCLPAVGRSLGSPSRFVPPTKFSSEKINDELFVCNSLESAIDLSNRIHNSKFLILNSKEIFIIGGGQIYSQAMKYADKLYLTVVDAEDPDADTFFPDYSSFSKIIAKEVKEENKQKFTFFQFEKL
jgi:dihydrofolate reductase